MTMLVFTRNFAMRQAIESLSDKDRQVFYFENRLQLLVCATVLHNPYVVIDTIHEASDAIRWLYPRLCLRGLAKNIYFIVPEKAAENSYLKSLHLVRTIKELREVCSHAARIPVSSRRGELREVLYRRLSEKLSTSHLDFMMNYYDQNNRYSFSADRSSLNKLRYLRSRLHLENGLEMKQLIAILSSQVR